MVQQAYRRGHPQAVGGSKNVTSATHCMTRLRLVLKDESSIDDDEVKAVDGVMGVVHGGQQYQIVVGTNVPRVYAEFCSVHVNELRRLRTPRRRRRRRACRQEEAYAHADPEERRRLHGGLHDPDVPVPLTGGLAMSNDALCGPQLLGLYPAESDIYVLFDFIYDAALYFMPIGRLCGEAARHQRHARRIYRVHPHVA